MFPFVKQHQPPSITTTNWANNPKGAGIKGEKAKKFIIFTVRKELTVVGAAPALVKMGYNYHFKGNISLPVDSNYHERSLKRRLSGGIREFFSSTTGDCGAKKKKKN